MLLKLVIIVNKYDISFWQRKGGPELNINEKNLDNYAYDKENADEEVFEGEGFTEADILKDGTDYTDVAEIYKNRKRNNILITIAVVALIAVGIFAGSWYLLSNPEAKKEPSNPAPVEATTSNEPQTTETVPPYDKPNNPVTELLPNLPETNNDEISVVAENNTLQTSHGNILTITDAETFSTVHKCSVRKETDLCNIAEVFVNDITYNSYYFKNAAESSFFNNADNFQTVEIPGAAAAATMTVSTIDGTPTPILVILQDDGTGFMFSTDNEDLTTLSESISVN